MALRQGKDESLKNLLFWFNKEKLMGESPNEETVLNALMHGVNAKGPPLAKLAKSSKTITLHQFLNKTKEYINLEEMLSTLLKTRKEEDQPKESSNKVAPVAPRKKEEKNPKKLGKKAGPLYTKGEPRQEEGSKFTPLNTRISEVFMEIRRDPACRWPTKMKRDPKRCGRTKFYVAFDKKWAFDKKCVALCHEIESFIRNGKLVRFL